VERGRPRVFDEEEALEAALRVFWRCGYQGASLAELTRAMGISKPSLYAAFGNKEQLYLKALERYREQQLMRHAEAMAAEPDLKQAVRVLLRSVAAMLTARELPGGCMVVNSAVVCASAAVPRRVVAAIRKTIEQSSRGLLKERLHDELQRRNLPEDTSIEELADYFLAIMCGMGVMAKVGVSESRLLGTIERAVCVLPDFSESD